MPRSSSPPVPKKKSAQAVGTYNLRYRTPRNASQNPYGGKYGFIGDVIVSASKQHRIASGNDSTGLQTSKLLKDKHQSGSSGSGSHRSGNPGSSTNEGGNNSARALYNITGPFSITNAAQSLITGPSHSNSSTGSPSTRNGLLNDIAEEGAPRRPVRPHREYRETFITFSPENEAEHAVQNTSPTDTSSAPLEEVHDTLDTSNQEENTPSAPEQQATEVTETPSPKASSPLLDPDMPIDERISAMLKELQEENEFVPSSRYTINRWNMARATLSDFDFETSGLSYNEAENPVTSTLTNNDEQAQDAAAHTEVVAPLNIKSLQSTKPSNTKAPLLARKRLPAPIITDFTNTNALNKETSAFRPVAISAGPSMSVTKEPTNQATSQKQYPMSPVAKGKQPIKMSNRLVSPVVLHRMNQTAEVAEASGSKQLVNPVTLPRMNQIPGVPEARKQSGEMNNTTGPATAPGSYQMSEVARGKQPMKMSNQLTSAVASPRMNQRDEVGEGSGLRMNQVHGVSEGRKQSGESKMTGSITSPGPYQMSEVARGKQPMNMLNQGNEMEMGEGSGSKDPVGSVDLPKMDQVHGVSEGRRPPGEPKMTGPIEPPGPYQMSEVARGKQPMNMSSQQSSSVALPRMNRGYEVGESSGSRNPASPVGLPRVNQAPPGLEPRKPSSGSKTTSPATPMSTIAKGKQPVNRPKQLTNPDTASNADQIAAAVQASRLRSHARVAALPRMNRVSGSSEVWDPASEPLLTANPVKAKKMYPLMPLPSGEQPVGMSDRFVGRIRPLGLTPRFGVGEVGRLAGLAGHRAGPVTPPGVNPVTVGAEMEAPMSIRGVPYTPPRGDWAISGAGERGMPGRESKDSTTALAAGILVSTPPSTPNPISPPTSPIPAATPPPQVVQAPSLPASPTAESVVFPVRSHSLPDLKNPTGNFCLPQPPRYRVRPDPARLGTAFVPLETVPEATAIPALPPSPPSSPAPTSPTNTPSPLTPTQQLENLGGSPAASVPQGPFAGYASFQEAMAAVERSRMEEAGRVSPTEDTLTEAETALLSHAMLAGPFPSYGAYEAAISSSRGPLGGAPARVLGRSGGPAGGVKRFFGLFRGRGGKGGSGGA